MKTALNVRFLLSSERVNESDFTADIILVDDHELLQVWNPGDVGNRVDFF